MLKSFKPLLGTARANLSLSGGTSLWSDWRIGIARIPSNLSVFEWHIHSYECTEAKTQTLRIVM